MSINKLSIQGYLTKYSHIPQTLKDTLVAVAHYFEQKEGLAQDSVTIEVTTNNGDFFSRWDKGKDTNNNTILGAYTLITYTGSGGKYPVYNIDGKPTFAQYDNMVGLIHELGHIIFDMLGVGTGLNDHDEIDELNNAILVKAVDAANGDIQKLIAILDGSEPGWSTPEKENMTKSSYENLYNNSRNFSTITGLSNTPDITREGYIVEGEWKTKDNTTNTSQLQGNLLNNDSNISLLGNQFANEIAAAKGNDYIDGGHGDDVLWGDGYIGGSIYDKIDYEWAEEESNDINGGFDIIIGGTGKDVIYGGGGNDSLYAGKKAANGYSEDDNTRDFLFGDSGNDTYYSNQKDIITDSDGSGKIYFDNDLLSGKKVAVQDTNGYMYEDSQYSYVLDNPNGVGKLTILEGTNATGFTGKEIFVNNFDATKEGGYLGITLTKKEIEITVEDSIALEGGDLEFRVNINQTLDKDLVLSVDSYFSGSAESNDITMPSDKTITIKAGEKTATYKVAAVDDEKEEPTENFIFAVTQIEPDRDDTSTCKGLRIANNISTCCLHVERIQQNKRVA